MISVVSGQSKRFDALGMLLLAVVACAVVGGLALLIPERPAKPIGDAIQTGTGEHRGVVLKINPNYPFYDGAREGWLIRNEHGSEAWIPRDQMKKAELVRR